VFKVSVTDWTTGLSAKLAVKAVRRDGDVASAKIRLIAKFATNPNRFIPAKSDASEAICFYDETLGIRTSYRNRKILAIRDEALDSFAGSRDPSQIVRA
jgi:hypothetical protein